MRHLHRAGPWLLVTVVPVEVTLVILLMTGARVPDPVRAGAVGVVVLIVLIELSYWWREYRRCRRAGATTRAAAVTSAAAILPTPAVTAMRWEGRIWWGLVRGMFRRPDIPAGATAFTHHRALAPVRWMGLGLLVVEVVVVHLVVTHGTLRVVLLMIGMYSLVWMAGYLLGSGTVRPHLVDDRQVVLRRGLSIDVAVPLDVIRHVHPVRHGRTGTATIQVDDQMLSLVDNGATSLELRLSQPLTVPLPRGRSADVVVVRAWVDDPAAMSDAIERAMSGSLPLSDLG